MSASDNPTSLRIPTDTEENPTCLLPGEDRKTTTPIHLLPSELLSLIFERCSWYDWKSPLRVGCVCFNWRHVALNTPRAWCTIAIGNNKPLQEVYFERSGQSGLHISSTSEDLLPVNIIGRIECIHLQIWAPFEIFSYCFPRLERLSVSGACPRTGHYTISTSSFPMLRHFKSLEYSLPEVMDCSSMPALETLSLYARGDNRTWLFTIQGCTASLTSLALYLSLLNFDETPVDIQLPKLYYLNIRNPRCNLSWLSINAPSLRVYLDVTIIESKRCRIVNGLQLITHMRISTPRSLHSLSVSNICTLQTRAAVSVYRELLKEIRTGVVNLPYLKDLQFLSSDWFKSSEDAQFGQEVEEWNSRNDSPITLAFFNDWRKEPPWNLSFPCGEGSPCTLKERD